MLHPKAIITNENAELVDQNSSTAASTPRELRIRYSSHDERRRRRLLRPVSARGRLRHLRQISSVFAAPSAHAAPRPVLVSELAAAAARGGRVFVHGVGREGLMMRALCMRLAHLGLPAHCVGDVTAPPALSGDLLVASAGPGAFPTVDAICGVARGAGARVVLLTARPEGDFPGRQADVVAHLPAQTMADDEDGTAAHGSSQSNAQAKLPMGSLYTRVPCSCCSRWWCWSSRALWARARPR